MGDKRKGGPKSLVKRFKWSERNAQIVQMRKNGMVAEDIARTFDLTPTRVYQILNEAIAAIVNEPAEQYLKIHIARLESSYRDAVQRLAQLRGMIKRREEAILMIENYNDAERAAAALAKRQPVLQKVPFRDNWVYRHEQNTHLIALKALEQLDAAHGISWSARQPDTSTPEETITDAIRNERLSKLNEQELRDLHRIQAKMHGEEYGSFTVTSETIKGLPMPDEPTETPVLAPDIVDVAIVAEPLTEAALNPPEPVREGFCDLGHCPAFKRGVPCGIKGLTEDCPVCLHYPECHGSAQR